jgi:hypothetical protein
MNKYILKQFTFFVDLRNFRYEGTLVRSIEEEIKKHIPTARNICAQAAGTSIGITRDMISSPGYCLMSHPSKKTLMKEYLALRAMEDRDLYMVKEETASESVDTITAPGSSHCCSEDGYECGCEGREGNIDVKNDAPLKQILLQI